MTLPSRGGAVLFEQRVLEGGSASGEGEGEFVGLEGDGFFGSGGSGFRGCFGGGGWYFRGWLVGTLDCCGWGALGLRGGLPGVPDEPTCEEDEE